MRRQDERVGGRRGMGRLRHDAGASAQWCRCVGAFALLNRSKPIGVGAGSDARRVDNARDRGLVKARRPCWAGRRNGERGRGVAACIRLPCVGAGSAFVASATPVIAVLSKRCARVGRIGGMRDGSRRRGARSLAARWRRAPPCNGPTGERCSRLRTMESCEEASTPLPVGVPFVKDGQQSAKALKAPLQRRDGTAPSFRDVTVESDMRALIQWRFL